MKIIPLHRRGAGVGCGEPEDPPRRLAPSAPPEKEFSQEPPCQPGGAIEHKNIALVLVVVVVLSRHIRVR